MKAQWHRQCLQIGKTFCPHPFSSMCQIQPSLTSGWKRNTQREPQRQNAAHTLQTNRPACTAEGSWLSDFIVLKKRSITLVKTNRRNGTRTPAPVAPVIHTPLIFCQWVRLTSFPRLTLPRWTKAWFYRLAREANEMDYWGRIPYITPGLHLIVLYWSCEELPSFWLRFHVWKPRKVPSAIISTWQSREYTHDPWLVDRFPQGPFCRPKGKV